LRTGIVSRPEDYRCSSLGYHVQTISRGSFLSTDFGLKEFNSPTPADKCLKSKKERIRRYRRYVYEAGAIGRPDKMQTKVIEDNLAAKERKKEFEISRIDRFRYRTRYFTDSGIIGSKQFLAANYQLFKHLFHSKHEKKPKPIKGLEGMYSLKRLSEIVKNNQATFLAINSRTVETNSFGTSINVWEVSSQAASSSATASSSV
jgi:putative transposase